MLSTTNMIRIIHIKIEEATEMADTYLKTAQSFGFNSKGHVKFMNKYRNCLKAIEQYNILLEEIEPYEK